ncbi:extracellular solute-binding protein [Labrys portucalensis]|uniref:Extracellular solute-binding protein n=1 Tax=Labrys neptuniae TaxID=376174 RepID=A0ABV6ZEN1_9HYPH
MFAPWQASAEEAVKPAETPASATPSTTPPWRIGFSPLGTPKHGQAFDHFDYVNPDAPKGGRLRMASPITFDSFNVTLAGVRGIVEPGLARVYQNLMTSAQDEPNTYYGELAEALRYPDDMSWVSFRLNPKARWQDGQPVTPEDVVWSFDTLKANNIQQERYYHDVIKAQVSGPNEVTFSFSSKGNRELPLIVGQLIVQPKHWWLAKGPDGKPRNIAATSLEPPLGSGPYRVKTFEAGRSITYERVKDWWGAALPTARGMYNFDEIRYDYYANATQLPELFKTGSFDFRSENSASAWVQQYNIPAVKDGRIVKQEFRRATSGIMQAFGFNLRRAKFQDERVRQAFNLAYDFETQNRTMSFGLLERVNTYFFGLDIASKGLPEGKELALLQDIKDKVPPAVFTTPYANPVNGSDEAVRANLRKAFALLKDAGWEIRDGKLTNVASGEVMKVELLLQGEGIVRTVLPYQQSLKRLGVELILRTVDDSQYQTRVLNRDFDMIIYLQSQSNSPGNELRDFWGSAAADRPTSRNELGVKDAGVDALIERVIYAKDRDEQVAVVKALDRVMLAHNYVVPMFYSSVDRTLRWDRFGQPAALPALGYMGGFPDIWWYDEAKAAKIGTVEKEPAK